MRPAERLPVQVADDAAAAVDAAIVDADADFHSDVFGFAITDFVVSGEAIAVGK